MAIAGAGRRSAVACEDALAQVVHHLRVGVGAECLTYLLRGPEVAQLGRGPGHLGPTTPPRRLCTVVRRRLVPGDGEDMSRDVQMGRRVGDDHDDAALARAERGEQMHQAAVEPLVQARGRLVQHQQGRLCQHLHRDVQPPALPTRQGPCGPVGDSRQPQPVFDGAHPLLADRPVDVAGQPDVGAVAQRPAHRELGKRRVLLRDDAHQGGADRVRRTEWDAVEGGATGDELRVAQQTGEQGGLADAGRADDREQAAAGKAEVDAGHRRRVVRRVPDADAVDLERGRRGDLPATERAAIADLKDAVPDDEHMTGRHLRLDDRLPVDVGTGAAAEIADHGDVARPAHRGMLLGDVLAGNLDVTAGADPPDDDPAPVQPHGLATRRGRCGGRRQGRRRDGWRWL